MEVGMSYFFSNQRSVKPAIVGALFATLFVCISCEPEAVKTKESLRIVSWNIQNLFDAVEDGTEYTEFTAAGGWTEERLAHRLELLAVAAKALLSPGVPDVIVLLEVENEHVLSMFRDSCLQGRGYIHQAWAGSESMAVGVGVLSRRALKDLAVHQFSVYGEEELRPVLECAINIMDEDVRIFACHWKSKLGGADETEHLRRRTALLINRRLAELADLEPKQNILLMGDLNCNIDEFDRRNRTVATALLPPTGLAMDMAGSESSILVDSKAGWDEKSKRIVFMSPWLHSDYEGSYCYSGNWETIDHILLGPGFFDKQAWEYRGFVVFDSQPFTNAAGMPFRYSPNTGLGYSDHLPVAVDLNFVPLP